MTFLHAFPRKPRRQLLKGPRHRPMLETLEDRLTPSVSASIGDAMLVEGNSLTTKMNFTVTLTRTGPDSGGDVIVDYKTQDGTATTADNDYLAFNSFIVILAGQTTGTISIDIVGDTFDEVDQNFSVVLIGIRGPIGTPTFGAQQNFPEGPGGANHIATADINGDNKPDIIAADAASNTISVLLNSSTGTLITLAAVQNFTLATGPTFVAAGDLNGDSKPDLAVAVGTDLYILMNTTINGSGTATFSTATIIPMGVDNIISSLVIDDFSGDGRNDVAVSIAAAAGTGQVTVIMNGTGTGAASFTVADQQSFATTGKALTVAAIDFNNDGIKDIAASDDLSDVFIWLNTTTSASTTLQIGPLTGFSLVSFNITSLKVADMNGDNKQDLVGSTDAGSVVVLRNMTGALQPAPTFAAAQFFAGTGIGQEIAIGDVNGDLKGDILLSSSGSNNVSVFLNTTPFVGGPAVSFAPRIDLAASNSPKAQLVDLDGDGWLDIASGFDTLGTIGVRRNTAAVFSDNLAIGTIINDDLPIATLHLSGSPFSENGGVATVTAVLDRLPTLGDVTITLGFTGTAGTGEYTPSSTTIVIPNGSPSGFITLTGVDDFIDESIKTVKVDITGITGGFENGVQQVTAIMTDDDGAPDLTIDVTGSPIAENGGVATVTATLDAITSLDVTVSLALTGTAIGSDYLASSATIFIPAGQLSGSVTLTGVDDSRDEADETILVDAVSVINATYTPTQFTVIITDDDPPPLVTLGMTGSPIAENGGIAIVTATLSTVSGQNVTVNLGYTGTAASGDYTGALTIVIGAGALSNSINITGVNDIRHEPVETIVIDITGVTNGVESGAQQVTINITDDDPPPLVTLGLSGTPIAENGGVAIVSANLSTASAFDVTVDLTFTGTASGSDYTPSAATIFIPAGNLTGTVTLTATQDLLDEPAETIIVDITGTINATENGIQQVIATIADDDGAPDVTLSLTGSPIAENGGVATVTATLSAVSGQNVTVFLSFSGTASTAFPADYTPSSTFITIFAGTTTGSITLTGVDDVLNEALESITVDISSVINGNEFSFQQVTASILDDDPQPTVGFTTTTQTAVEVDGQLTVTLQLSAVSGRDVTINYSTSGNSDPGEFTIPPSPIVIPAGSLTATLTIGLIDDQESEGPETKAITLTTPTNATLNANSLHTITVNDNDFGIMVLGSDAGSPPRVQVLNAANLLVTLASFTPAYSPSYLGGIRVAVGDVNGDKIPDIVTITGKKYPGGPEVKVFDGRPLMFGNSPTEIASFKPYEIGYKGEVSLAVGDLNLDGFADIVLGDTRKAGPTVRVFDGETVIGGPVQELMQNFQPFGFRYRGGLRVALGNIDNDNVPDFIVGQSQNGSRVIVVSGVNPRTVLTNFQAAPTALPGGVFVAGVLVDSDNLAEIVVGYGSGAKSTVRVYQDEGSDDTKARRVGQRSTVFGAGFRGGVRVAGFDIDRDGFGEIFVAPGRGQKKPARILDGFTLQTLDSVFATEPGVKPGRFLAASWMG